MDGTTDAVLLLGGLIACEAVMVCASGHGVIARAAAWLQDVVNSFDRFPAIALVEDDEEDTGVDERPAAVEDEQERTSWRL